MNNFRLSFIAGLTILTAICGCKKDNSIATIFDDKNITTIAGTWKVVSYDDFINNTQIKKDVNNTWTDYNNGDIIITFEDSLSTGQIQGRTVTNEVWGNYTLSSPRSIKVENLSGTEINEPGWAVLFRENLPKSEEYSVNSKQLRIFYLSKKKSITFEKE